MQVRDAVNRKIRPLRAADSAREAIAAMISSGLDMLPVVDQTTGRLIGIVSRKSMEDIHPDTDGILASRDRQVVSAEPDQNVFDTVRLMNKHGLPLIPVMDHNHHYLGSVDRDSLNSHIVRIMNLTEYGSLITIHLEERDFTLSKLVRLIEEEGGHILGIAVEPPQNKNPFYTISVKLNVSDPVRIVSCLERHRFLVIVESSDRRDIRRFEERADELMHYLDL